MYAIAVAVAVAVALALRLIVILIEKGPFDTPILAAKTYNFLACGYNGWPQRGDQDHDQA